MYVEFCFYIYTTFYVCVLLQHGHDIGGFTLLQGCEKGFERTQSVGDFWKMLVMHNSLKKGGLLEPPQDGADGHINL